MEEKLQQFKAEAAEIGQFLAGPEAYAAPDFAEKSKRLAELNSLVVLMREIQNLKQNLIEVEALIGDPELGEMAMLDKAETEKKLAQKEQELEEKLMPRDPNDEKPVIIEIRAGAGGDEASLFAGELYRMVNRMG